MLVGFAASVVADNWRRLAHYRDELLNRHAGQLYRKFAEREFGTVRVERADLPDEAITRLVIPLRGEDLDHEVSEALERVSVIHDLVERQAPELVGRIVFDYSSNARDT